jgi:asparagine synthase (glutamine-hydrolysing)
LGAFAARYEEIGEAALRELRGSFAIAIHDARRDKLVLAVDKMGTRPLAYHASTKALVFATSVSAVTAHSAVSAPLDLQSLYDYLYFHVVPSPETVYAGVAKLEPASYLVHEGGVTAVRRYWTPDFDRNPDPDSLRAARDQLLQTIMRAVAERSTESASAAFLSGGVDSSTVAGCLRRLRGAPVAAYTIGFAAEGYDEMEFAAKAAEHFDLALQRYYVTAADVASSVPAIAAAYDEPFGNPSAIAVHYCARLAREQGVEVLLAGDGGDELFAGNKRYATQQVLEAYRRIPGVLRRHVLEPLARPGFDALPSPLRKLQSYVRRARIEMPMRLEAFNMLATDVDVLHPAFAARIDKGRPSRLLRATYERPTSNDLLDRMLFLDWKFTLADNDLRKVNRMCETNGIEPRYPLLDDAIVELSLQIPSAQLLKKRQLRFFFKDALRDFLPRSTLEKQKHGFGVPFGLWLRTSQELQDVVTPLLESLKRRNLVQPRFIDGLVAKNSSDHPGYFGSMIWPLVILEQWLQTRGHDLRL